MEEPVCEPQAIALYYVTRMAKDYVKVLIREKAETKRLRDIRFTEMCSGLSA